MKKQKKPILGKRMKAALEYLRDAYTIKTIDKENCIYIDLGNYDIEISEIVHPLKGPMGRAGVCNYVCVWDFFRIGSRGDIIWDWDLLDAKLKELDFSSAKKETEVIEFGKLRKVQI